MQNDKIFDSVEQAVADAIRQYGAKSDAINRLTEELRQQRISVNDSFQTFPQPAQKQQVFHILTAFYEQNRLDENDKSCVLYALINLNIKKDKLCGQILRELHSADPHSERFIWELCDMLYALRQKPYREAYIDIARNSDFGAGRQMIFLLMEKLKDECYLPVILESLHDETVNGHALSALRAFKDKQYDVYFTGFLNDKRRWVRRIAETRLDSHGE